jgi:hypothetical protein
VACDVPDRQDVGKAFAVEHAASQWFSLSAWRLLHALVV